MYSHSGWYRGLGSTSNCWGYPLGHIATGPQGTVSQWGTAIPVSIHPAPQETKANKVVVVVGGGGGGALDTPTRHRTARGDRVAPPPPPNARSCNGFWALFSGSPAPRALCRMLFPRAVR